MFSLDDELRTGRDFVNHLNTLFHIKNKNQDEIVELALDAWSEWDRHGSSQPDDVNQVASDPMQVYREYCLDILAICDVKNLNPDSIFLTLLPIKNLNAYATTTKNKDKVIVFDENLIAFFTAIIIAAMIASYVEVTEDELNTIDEFIIKNLDDFYNRNKVRTKKDNEEYTDIFMSIIKRDYQMTEIGSYFSMAFTVFILCHELSHHILDHSEDKRLYALSNQQNIKREIPINTPSYDEEYEADRLGYELFLDVINNNEQAKVAKLTEAYNRAPFVFFELLDITQSYAEKKNSVSLTSDSHPSPKNRKERLLKQFESKLHTHGIEYNQGFMNYSQRIKKKLMKLYGE